MSHAPIFSVTSIPTATIESCMKFRRTASTLPIIARHRNLRVVIVKKNSIAMKRVLRLEDIIVHGHSVTEGVVKFPPGIGTMELMPHPWPPKKRMVPTFPFLAWHLLGRKGFIAQVEMPIHSLQEVVYQVSVVTFWPLPRPGHWIEDAAQLPGLCNAFPKMAEFIPSRLIRGST